MDIAVAQQFLREHENAVLATWRRDQTGLTSLLLHYPPSYGHEQTMQSLRLFAERVMPAFRPPRREAVA